MLCILKGKTPILALSGIVTAAVGFVMYFVFPVIMQNEIKKRLVLKEGTEAYTNWIHVPVPIYISFYFFNITNTEEIYNLTKKPVLQQLGPYTFREEREKVILSLNKNGTITYRQIRRWYYEEDRTNGSLDDIVTTLNVPMVAAAAKGREMDKAWIYFGLQETFEIFQSSWFIQKSVRELLFDGYEDPLMKLAEKFVHVPLDKFGWFYKRNGTDDGELNIFSGQHDIERVDEVDTWNGRKTTPAFTSPCNMINGSAGDIWSPNLTPSSTVTMFVTDICRSMSFKYLSEVHIKGVRAYRYFTDERQLDNGEHDPSNRCFCGGDVCLPAGAVNVSSCKFDAPVVVSYPHFLFADPVYRDGVTGMDPNPDEHRMSIDIVPEMGVPIGVAARMQINIIFEAIPKIMQFQNITKRIYFPIFWFSETAVATEDLASQFKLVLNTIPTISNVFSLLSILTGIILTVAAVKLSNNRNKTHPSYSAVVPE